MHTSSILITCAKGISPFLKNELVGRGFPIRSEKTAGVETYGTLADCMRLNLALRTAHRVLFQLDASFAKQAEDLYERVAAVAWEDFVPEDGYLCVTASVEQEGIRDVRYAALKCKDAIVDRLRQKTGRRPDSGPERRGTVVHLYWKDDRCVLYLDTSGEPLSRRGYRKIPLEAPMQETLAAAVVFATSWDGSSAFINPMCGSGTLAIEAALMGLGREPGLLRSNFGFMHLKGFDEKAWKDMRDRARTESRKSLSGKIIATDINPIAVDAARKNAATAGVEHVIEFSACSFEDTAVPEGAGVIVLNPEYGERMGDRSELEGVYKRIGDYFKKKCTGYTGYVFTGSPKLAKRVGLKPKQRWEFFNSNIQCRLLEYDLY
ncbi:MAG TPA: class I SAM-dependent RNA methyltransferase [Nitrospirota bacterium]|nr:class I SAM-dependent RNA methyltransferase [Nitrospirota bacterium]